MNSVSLQQTDEEEMKLDDNGPPTKNHQTKPGLGYKHSKNQN